MRPFHPNGRDATVFRADQCAQFHLHRSAWKRHCFENNAGKIAKMIAATACPQPGPDMQSSFAGQTGCTRYQEIEVFHDLTARSQPLRFAAVACVGLRASSSISLPWSGQSAFAIGSLLMLHNPRPLRPVFITFLTQAHANLSPDRS